jgi:hypothetical protein
MELNTYDFSNKILDLTIILKDLPNNLTLTSISPIKRFSSKTVNNNS